jgi:hypothetical protein
VSQCSAAVLVWPVLTSGCWDADRADCSPPNARAAQGLANASVRLVEGDPFQACAPERDGSFSAVLSTYVLDILSGLMQAGRLERGLRGEAAPLALILSKRRHPNSAPARRRLHIYCLPLCSQHTDKFSRPHQCRQTQYRGPTVDDVAAFLTEAWRLLEPDGKLCLVNLGEGCTPATRLGSAVWGAVHALAPTVCT